MIQIVDKSFETFLSAEKIQEEIQSVANRINSDYAGKEVVFIAVLNGSFMFASDLFKRITLDCEISFVKVSSYKGSTASSGRVDELIGLNTNIEGKNVIILEDIVDTGITIDKIFTLLRAHQPTSVQIATLLYKPDAFKGKNAPHYVGFLIPNFFVVGYGLDYNERGRNLDAIYKLKGDVPTQNTMLNLVLFGPPGAGKGTQSERLIEKYGLVHLSTGDIFRANIKGETELGKLAKSYMDKGSLVPDEVTINMLRSEVMKYENPKGFIFDGFPRTTAQAVALDEFLNSLQTSITLMLALDVEENELRERLMKRAESSGRPDDADPAIIQNRINVYKNETAPVKAFYEAQQKFASINGIGSIDEISDRLYQAIDELK
ncbi:MAG: adenylate kinase [Crocinitomicaceae bacterium]|nr:MAG: adenylate kinase [Crocinitomicaceae bacterium]